MERAKWSKWGLLVVLLGMMVAMSGCFGGGGIVKQTGSVEGWVYVSAPDYDIDEPHFRPEIRTKVIIGDDPVPPEGTYALKGAAVKIVGVSRGAITEQDGYFRLKDIPVGIHQLVISHKEFKDYTTESFAVYANRPTKIAEEIYGVGYYIIVGVNEYSDSFVLEFPMLGDDEKQLKGTVNDVTYIQDWLADDGYNSLKTDLAVVMVNPTAEEMLEEVEDLANGLRPRDYLVIYFSGHAISDRILGDSLVCYNRLLTDGELADALSGAASTDITLILDGCQTGSFADGLITRPKAFQRTPYSVLASSEANGFSYEEPVSGYGTMSIFTNRLIDGLETRTIDLDRDGKVTVSEVYAALYEGIADHTRDSRVYMDGPQKIFRKIGDTDSIIFKYW